MWLSRSLRFTASSEPPRRHVYITTQAEKLREAGSQTENHGQRRHRRAGLTGVATLLARSITLSVSLLSLPFASHYLGKERFGLWLTLVGLVNWIGLTDLGLSNSLISALATAEGKGETARAQKAVASAFWLSIAVALGLLLLFLSAAPFVDWARVFNLSTAQARAEISLAIAVVFGCFLLRMLAGLLASVYAAYQEGYVYQCWSALCGLLSAAGLLLAIRAQAGLPGLIGGFVGGWLLGELCSAVYLFGWHRPALRPAWRHFDRAEALYLLRNGGQLWLAQISAIALLQTDLLVVTQLFGAQAVAAYGTALRLFNFVGSAQAAFVAPLWAAYSEALARRDYPWLAQTFRHSLALSLSFVIPAALFVAWAAPWLFGWLVTADVQPNGALLIALFATEVLNAAARCIAMLLNGLGAIRSQAVFGPIAGLVNLALSVLLGKAYGVAGVAWATAICLGLFWIVLLGREARWRVQSL
jgi:O-antigen/teichoic acid export membrane protein